MPENPSASPPATYEVAVLGCKVNQYEAQQIRRRLDLNALRPVREGERADVVVVNTCAVTGKAVADSRKKIRQSLRAGAPQVIATGCWATLEPIKTAQLSEMVQVVEGMVVMDLDRILSQVMRLYILKNLLVRFLDSRLLKSSRVFSHSTALMVHVRIVMVLVKKFSLIQL